MCNPAYKKKYAELPNLQFFFFSPFIIGTSSLFGSQNEGLDSFGDAHCEIYAGDLLDEFEEAKYNPLWTMKGYTQIFHSWRESKRCQSIPLSSACTYVMLPWWSIIKSVLDEQQQQPLLTF